MNDGIDSVAIEAQGFAILLNVFSAEFMDRTLQQIVELPPLRSRATSILWGRLPAALK